MDFNPQKAIETLRQNAVQIGELGELLETKRNALIVSHAALMDAEQTAREQVFGGKIEVQASKLREWLKFQVFWQERAYELQRDEVRLLEQKLDILVECNNSLKAAHRITEMEMKNLSLTQPL